MELEDLGYEGLRLYQSRKLYRFTSDAVLLANVVKAGRRDRVIDIGTGSGIIAVLIAAKRGASVIGIEIQRELADMARLSVGLNGLGGLIEIAEVPAREADRLFGAGRFDVAVCNPPYKRIDGESADISGLSGKKLSDALAKTEAALTLKEAAESASRLLKFGGRFYTVIKAERLYEYMRFMDDSGIKPKELTLVQPYEKKPPDTALIVGVKGGGPGLKVHSPLIVYDKDRRYTPEVSALYGEAVPEE